MTLVSFDLDGVLQRNPFHMGHPEGVFGHIQRELAPYVQDAESPEAALKAPLALIIQEHRARLYSDRMVASLNWDDIVATVATRLDYPGRIDVAALVRQYCEVPSLVYAYPGARAAMEALHDAGHTMVAITNGFRCYQEPVLRKIGLLDLFTALITPDAAQAAKPDPAIFRAAEAYGGPGIHIGDTLPHDLAGAKRSGWKGILIVQPGAPGATELPAELAALAPWERPAQGEAWLLDRLERDRRWHGHPPAELAECWPDAIVTSLAEVPVTVERL